MSSVSTTILQRIRRRGRGSVFTPSDFLDLGKRAAVDQALFRLTKKGQLRRLARGLYDYPQVHSQLGPLVPTADAVAHAVARGTRSTLQISGAQAANALGLSTQVPARVVYLTNGPSRRVILGKRIVDLRHASPKYLIAPGSTAGTVVQALRHLGPDCMPTLIDAVAPRLTARDRRALANGIYQAPAWMRPVLTELAGKSV